MSHGEEVAFRFDADVAGKSPAGARGDSRERTFLFFGHGYEKGWEPHSGHARTVDPLPSRAMNSYPYDPEKESYPADETHAEYLIEWNSRPSYRSAGR